MRSLNQPIRFVLVSGLNTLFGYSVYILLVYLGVNYSLALLMATILGVIFNFNTIGKLVFGKKDERVKTFLKFVSVYAFIYLIQAKAIESFQTILPNFYIAGLLVILPGALFAFILNKSFVFRSYNEAN